MLTLRCCLAVLMIAGLAMVTASCATAAAKPIGLTLHNPLDFPRGAVPVTGGVPLAKGFAKSVDRLALLGPDGKPVPVQVQATSTYKDGSPRWVLLNFGADVPAKGKAVYQLVSGGAKSPAAKTKLSYKLAGGVATVDTGAAQFRIDTKKFRLFDSVKIGGAELIGKAGANAGAVLLDDKGKTHRADKVAATAKFEDAGPLRAVLCVKGEIGPRGGRNKLPLTRFVCRMHFYAGRPEVRVFFTLHNPGAHNHPGNIWEYGAGGSAFIEDFSLSVPMVGDRSRASGPKGPVTATKVYQDSSGGPNWQSVNHIDKDYKVPVTFRGYRVYQGDGKVAEGHRVDGWLHAGSNRGGVAVGVRDFWQNFPKALEFKGGAVRVSLWPGEYAGVHELLGGEQKTHEILFAFHGANTGPHAVLRDMLEFHSPMYLMPDPDAVLASNCFWPNAPVDREKYKKLEQTIDIAVYPRGGVNRTLQTQWDFIDEYDWRHFGEMFADNERSPAKMRRDHPKHHPGGRPISHYVNEYEGIYSTFMHGLRRGDPKWMWMADVMSRHHADICIYHTKVGAKAYSGGSFMHTTHDTAAFRSGMRTYPIEAKNYRVQYGQGGGPNAGHTYVICLAQHYYLTGDRVSRDAFLEVADWAADSTWFRKGGMGDKRGFGNFFVTFVYAYQLTGNKKYYDRAMTLCSWIDASKPFRGLGGTLLMKAGARFLQMKIDNGELDDDYKRIQALMMKFGDMGLTVKPSAWARYMEQRCNYAELLCLAYLYAPKDHPNREKYYAKGRSIIDEALDKFRGAYVSCKSWNMCFSNIGAYLKSGLVHAAEAEGK